MVVPKGSAFSGDVMRQRSTTSPQLVPRRKLPGARAARVATFYVSGTEHSATGATGSAFERTPWLKGCLRLELADHRVGSLEEPPALGGADRLARDEPLAQGVHELSVLRHPVVQVRPGGEPGRADPADDLALADSHATPDARVDLREVVVHRGVARAVADRHGDAVAAVPARRRDDAVGHGAHRRADRD